MNKKYFVIVLLYIVSFSVNMPAQSIEIGEGAEITVGSGADICATDNGNISGSLTGDGTECGGTLPVEITELNACLSDNGIPNEFGLSQNYPNPFNPATNIKYQLADTENVTLKVYDILGREVLTLVSETQDAGYYNVLFNASSLTSGVYIYRLTAGNYTSVKKLLLVK